VQKAGWDPGTISIDTQKRKPLPPTKFRTPNRPVGTESLYRLRYSGNWNISDFVVLSCGSAWKSWLNLLPSRFVEIVTEDMMLHDCSYSRARSSTLHIKKWQRRFARYQQQLVRAWQIGCADCRAHTLGRLSTEIQFYNNYGHFPPTATDHSVQPSTHAVSGVLNSWS
jgi:hypothetical protein